MEVKITFWIVVVISAVCSNDYVDFTDIPNPVNIDCMLTKCTENVAACLLDEKCREAVACVIKCWNQWNQDTTSEKYHVQNCTNTCAFSYKDKAYLGFMNCVGNHKCIEFPPIPSKCKGPEDIKILRNFSTEDLKGDWWTVGGKHPVYDCYPCQHSFFEQVNASTWRYQPNYYVYLENGSLALMNDVYYIPNTTAGSPISFSCHYAGLLHNEVWYLVDGAEDGSYILQYYCGNTLEWYFDAFIVMSRTRTLPESSFSAIANSVKQATGLDYSTFCRPQTVGCQN